MMSRRGCCYSYFVISPLGGRRRRGATVDDLAPTNAATVVQAHPCGAAEGVAYHVVNSHVGAELRAVVDVAGLAEWRVGAAHWQAG